MSALHDVGELPGLMGGVARARQIAQQTIDFFHEAVFAHHTEEEKDLFMIVLAKAELSRLDTDGETWSPLAHKTTEVSARSTGIL